MRCQKTKQDGERCRANALSDGKFCSLHSDSRKAAELGSKGGRRRAIFNSDNLKRFPAPQSATDVRDLLAQSMVELRAGELDPRIVSSMCCLVAEFLKALEHCTIEEVIEPLEKERAQAPGITHAANGNKEDA